MMTNWSACFVSCHVLRPRDHITLTADDMHANAGNKASSDIYFIFTSTEPNGIKTLIWLLIWLFHVTRSVTDLWTPYIWWGSAIYPPAGLVFERNTRQVLFLAFNIKADVWCALLYWSTTTKSKVTWSHPNFRPIGTKQTNIAQGKQQPVWETWSSMLRHPQQRPFGDVLVNLLLKTPAIWR